MVNIILITRLIDYFVSCEPTKVFFKNITMFFLSIFCEKKKKKIVEPGQRWRVVLDFFNVYKNMVVPRILLVYLFMLSYVVKEVSRCWIKHNMDKGLINVSINKK